MPMTAMIRNLGKMSALGLLKPLSSHAQHVCNQLRNEDLLRKARIHPFTVLQALSTYEKGHGEKGKLKWEVNQTVLQALDSAFYLAFKVSDHSFELGLSSSGVFAMASRTYIMLTDSGYSHKG